MSDEIQQIMPAAGWRAISVNRDGEVEEDPVVCFALLAPPYAERKDGPQETVVPMMMEGGSLGTGVGTADIVFGDAHYWNNENDNARRVFVGYLGPGEEQTLPWVQRRIEELHRTQLE